MRNLLDIQDKQISFQEDCVKYGLRRGSYCKFLYAKLTYTPASCVHCNAQNKNYTVIKNGNQESILTMPTSGVHPTYMVLKKQRFYCRACAQTFTAQSPLVKKDCFITNKVKVAIVVDTSTAQSVKDISEKHHVSQATTQRLIQEAAKQFMPYYTDLPEHLSFDEFKYKQGKLAFEYIDAKNGKVIDILPARDGRTVKHHFYSRYSLAARKKVKTVTVDMNASYIGFIPDLFPQADIIIDRFHLVQLINRSMNKTRVKVMNQFNCSNGEKAKKYRRLKRYWRKFLKHSNKISYSDYRFYPMMGQRTEQGILEELLAYDEELSHTYDLYQALLKAISDNQIEHFDTLLNQKLPKTISSYMKTSIRTLRKHAPYIQNTFTYPYSNGRIEGINNKIKVLNKVAYGYRSFNSYKSRIILHFNLKPRNKQKDNTTYKKKALHKSA